IAVGNLATPAVLDLQIAASGPAQLLQRLQERRVAGLLHAFGDHESDRVANIAHLVLRHDRMRRLLHRLPVLALDAPTAGQPVPAVGLEVGAGEYGKHAGHGARGARVDGLDFRMRVRRATKTPATISGRSISAT